MKSCRNPGGFRLILCALFALSAGYAPAAGEAIGKDQRALLVVVDLSDHVAENLKSYYQYFEGWAIDQVKQTLGNDYREIRVLSSKEATLAGVTVALGALASEAGIEVVDAFLEMHGLPQTMQFNESTYPSSEVREALLARGDLRGKLRAVYSAACYGTTDGPDLLAGGFRVVSGARKVNTNGLYDVPAFVKSWHAGQTFGASQDAGNEKLWRQFFDTHAERFGVSPQDADSYKDVYGDKDLTIQSPVSP